MTPGSHFGSAGSGRIGFERGYSRLDLGVHADMRDIVPVFL